MDNNVHVEGRTSGGSVEQIEKAAAAWLLKRESPQWSATDEAALEQWLQASTSHRVSFIRLRSVWQEAGRLKVVSGAFPAGHVPPRGAIGRAPFFAMKRRSAPADDAARHSSGAGASDCGERAPPRRIRYYALAGSIVIAVAAFTLVALNMWPMSQTSYSTAVGGLATVPIDDGSKITLNTASEIQLELSDRERRVKLVRGEAFFDVAKDPARPFVVYANDKLVIAVGTQFAVRMKPEGLQVIVAEGRVRVDKTTVIGRAEPLAELVAGNVAMADRNMVRVQVQPIAEVEQALSWRAGYVVLSKTSLDAAVAEFNRYNRRQLVIEDPALAEIQVGGNFKADNIDGFVRLLEEGFHIRAEEHNDRIVLTGTQ
jgi:transmembrane sensor